MTQQQQQAVLYKVATSYLNLTKFQLNNYNFSLC